MNPVVAVIAPGMMGAAVGRTAGRARPQGADLARPAAAPRRSRAPRPPDMASASDEEIAGSRLHPVDPAAGRRRGAGAAVRAGAHRQQQQAGLRRVQRGQPADGRAHRRRDRAHRLALRRRRHHRLAAEARRRRTALLRLRAAMRARFAALAAIRPRRARARRPAERGLGGEDVLCRHHQGHAGARRGDDAGGDARRLRRRAVRGAASRASRRCWPGSSAACR